MELSEVELAEVEHPRFSYGCASRLASTTLREDLPVRAAIPPHKFLSQRRTTTHNTTTAQQQQQQLNNNTRNFGQNSKTQKLAKVGLAKAVISLPTTTSPSRALRGLSTASPIVRRISENFQLDPKWNALCLLQRVRSNFSTSSGERRVGGSRRLSWGSCAAVWIAPSTTWSCCGCHRISRPPNDLEPTVGNWQRTPSFF